MKKTIIGIILLCSIVGFGVFMVSKIPQSPLSSLSPQSNQTSGAIKAGMTLGTYHQIETVNGKVTVGNPKESGTIKPEVTLSKWDGEANFKISYPSTGTPVAVENNKIAWQDKNQDVYFKTTLAKDSNNSGEKTDKFEFDILLKEKPASNVFTYNIDTQNLDFLYQPPLTEREKLEGYSRPENVIGSYAVYYKDGKTGDFSKMGGKDYKTGKAFHIYRPLITDANGKTAWGTLSIQTPSASHPGGSTATDRIPNKDSIASLQNDTNGVLTVTVDPTFLAQAAYPVTVDPTFGYGTPGGSFVDMNNSIRGSYFAIPENGTPTSISAYIYTYHYCFTGDTFITMSDDSYKKIKDVQIGDRVKSYNENTKKIVTDTVVKLFHHPAEGMGDYYLIIETDNGKKVEVTPNHRIYIEGKWVPAGYLKEGDSLLSDKNKKITIIKIEKVFKPVPTYNLEIKDNHVYFANFLVHNAKPSFLAGTKINMADSSFKDIQHIKTGDKVKSYNFKTKKIETSIVKKVMSQTHEDYLVITDIYEDSLKVTPGHPIFVNGRWKLARQMNVGDNLMSEFGDVKIKSIKEINEKSTAYNLIIPGNHNYYANGKLVDDESIVTQIGSIAIGSSVLTEQGYKKVEDLVGGEKVPTYNPRTYEIETGNITKFMIGETPQPVFIINNSLSLTGQTKIYTKMGEKKVEELKLGDELIHSNGKYIDIFSITRGLPRDVYSIDVSNNHNLFINDYLIHNETGYAKTAIYKQADNTQMITSTENAFAQYDTTIIAWRTFTISSSPTLTASTNYWLYTWGSLGTLNFIRLYYDSGGNGVNKSVAYGAWPDPLTGQTTDNNKYSIYATYTASPTNTPTPAPVRLKSDVRLKGGVRLR